MQEDIAFTLEFNGNPCPVPLSQARSMVKKYILALFDRDPDILRQAVKLITGVTKIEELDGSGCLFALERMARCNRQLLNEVLADAGVSFRAKIEI